MTSIHFDPSLFESPSEPESREQLIVNGRYVLPPIGDPTGKRRSLQRVTNFIKQLSDEGGLTRWKLRMAVTGLARDERRYDLACSLDPSTPQGKRDLDQLIEECIDLGQVGPSGGNITGTALHNLTDNVGHTPIRVRAKWAPKVENYHAALHAKGLRVVPGLSERLVVSERYGTCGRLDDVYEDPFGTLRVGDRKSQKEFQTWWEIGAQLALYQGSDAMWNEEECRFEDMPKLAGDLCHVAWMPLAHPDARKGGDVDAVTIYDIDLEGPREVLEWCLKVRTLRTQARRWGAERVDLDDFARVARDIRDAETHEDLTKLADRVNQGGGSHMLMEMASKRWEEIAAQPKPELPIAPAQVVIVPPGVQTQVSPGITVVHQGPGNVAMQAQPDNTVKVFASSGPMSQEEIERRRADVFAKLDEASEKAKKINGVVPASMLGDHQPDIVNGTLRAALEDATHEAASQWARGLVEFDPALFVAPSQDATFPEDGTGGGELPGAGRSDEALGGLTPEQYAEAIAPLPNPLAASTDEERRELQEQQWADGVGRRRKPFEWISHLDLDLTINTNADWMFEPMTLPEFRERYAAHIAQRQVNPSAAAVHALDEALDANGLGPVRDAIRDQGELKAPEEWAIEWDVRIVDPWGWTDQCTLGEKNYNEPISRDEFGVRMRQSSCQQLKLVRDEEARLQEIERRQSSPIVSTSTDDRETAIEALDSVPLKIVREVCTRANNSKSSRGRVRLLNDVEDKKYAAHGVELLPALLREWIECDGGATSAGFVKLTEGSSRQAMHSDRAGVLSLTAYLETKEVPKSAPSTEKAASASVRGDDAADAPVTVPEGFADQVAERKPGKPGFELTEESTANLRAMREREERLQADDDAPIADGTLAGDRLVHVNGGTRVRQKYHNILEGPSAGQHSILRLVELAKEAGDEHERDQVFKAIAKFHRWTGELAAEIQQHYLDNGQQPADLDEYFEEQERQEEGALIAESGLPLDPDDPATAQDALHLLEGVKDRATLALVWTQLSTKPYWHDQALQEGLLAKMVSLK